MKYKFKLFNNGCRHRKSWGVGSSSSGGSLLDLPSHLELSLFWELPASYAAAAASPARMDVRTVLISARKKISHQTRVPLADHIYHMLHKSKHSYLLQCRHLFQIYETGIIWWNPNLNCFQNIDLLHLTNLFQWYSTHLLLSLVLQWGSSSRFQRIERDIFLLLCYNFL